MFGLKQCTYMVALDSEGSRERIQPSTPDDSIKYGRMPLSSATFTANLTAFDSLIESSELARPGTIDTRQGSDDGGDAP